VFYFVLGCSIIFLLIVNLIAFHASEPLGPIIAVCIIFVVFPGFPFMLIMPPFLKQCLAIAAIALVWKTKLTPISSAGLSPIFFLVTSCIATLIIYAHASGEVEYRLARIRALYPFESVEDRLPSPDSSKNRPRLTAATVQRLAELESRRRDSGRWFDELKLLHEKSFALFVDSPGFGYVRLYDPSWWDPEFHRRIVQQVVPQPNLRDRAAWSPADLDRPFPFDSTAQILLLDDSLLKFATDGYVKDRRHVSGFRPHFFGSAPQNPNQWKVASIELVSLLLHKEPVVYVSKNLPRMRELQQAPTRPLDSFETYALGRIRQGEYIVASPSSEGARMLGAVYSLKQCVACHGGKRGDLLGAFSYVLDPVQP
jgi:hypothetical protein